MRFLFVGYFATKGGSAMATIPLALRLREEGHKVTFAHWSYPAHIELFTEADLFHVSLHEKRSLISKIFYLTQIAIHHDIILAVSELTITYACQIAGWLSRRPVCAEIQVNLDLWIQSNSSSLHLLLSRWFYPKLQAVRCVAQGLAEFAVTELKIDPKKVFTVYNPFKIDSITELSQQSLPKEAKTWFDVPVILCVGRLDSQKRFDLAISAFSTLQQSVKEPINLVILGEGPEHSKLEGQIIKLGLKEHVWLAGFHSNPYPFFANSNLFLLCSDYEGFGRVLVDAMVSGCPVIANDCLFGPSEILQQGESGLLIANNKPATIVNAILKMWNNSNLRSFYINQGYKRAKAFAEELVINRYIDEITKRFR